MTTSLVTFSDDSMSRSAGECLLSGARNGADTVTATYYDDLIKTDFYAANKRLLDQPRGIGYWAWKPFIILRRLGQMHDGDILIYADAGVEFINSVNYIIDRMDQDIFLFGNMWEHAHWCKRDIVDAVWPQVQDCSVWERLDEYPRDIVHRARFGKQVQASVIFFRVNDKTRAFVKEWLDWCLFEGGRLIDDSPSRLPNHPEFKENRHDQAILTTLAYREGYKLHAWPASYNDGAFQYPRDGYEGDNYPCLFNHHRRRNHEWINAA